MAKRVLVEFYTFNPSTRTITIPNRIIPQQNLLLVTNAKTNTVLFNFSDPDLAITNYTVPYESFGTQFTLGYNTTAMSSSDSLLILEDRPTTAIDFGETVQDPVNKLRVASPESLIDTDFEYGLQPIKWESTPLVNNLPSYFLRGGGNSLNVTSISTGSQSPRSLITVDCGEDHALLAGDVVNVIYGAEYEADGVFVVNTAPTPRRFTYTANAVVAGSPYHSSIIIQAGTFYNNNNLSQATPVSSIISDNVTGSMITVTTTGAHGLLPTSPILAKNATTNTINGNWVVFDVPTPRSFRYLTPSTQTGTSTPVLGSGEFYTRPEANFNHRPSDGGVIISTGRPQEGITAIRQTRKYFRYQSGKGIQFSTGTKVTPTWDITTISLSGTTCTITTDQRLSITSGATVRIEGVQVNAGATNPYNGTFTVTSVVNSSNTVTFDLEDTSTDTSPGGTPTMTCTAWTGSVTRTGMFDSQNGFFFEYDGANLYFVMRRSTQELMGRATVVQGSTTVTGINTKFSKQVVAGNYIVIRGQSYHVLGVQSDTSLQIAPAYRGISITGVRINLTEEDRYGQTQWNLDQCDGQGPSGFNLDVRKMQMFYIDYSWYGAGRVRYGFRGTDGSILYAHNVVNNNVNNQAYMRSGNLPARYEVSNEGPVAKLLSGNVAVSGQNLTDTATTLVIKDSYGQYWPSSGAVIVQQGLTSSEVMTYSGKTYNAFLDGWNLTGLTRRQPGGSTSNVTFVPTEFEGGTAGTSSQCSVNYLNCTCAPIVSHWGSSVIMDGGYGRDRSIVFSVSTARFSGGSKNINAGTSANLLAIRISPSVDNSIVGQLGAREVLNKMQLTPLSLGVISRGPCLITGILNPRTITASNMPGMWTVTSVVNLTGTGSLAQYCDFTSTTQTCIGGEQIFSFFVDVGADTYQLAEVRELGSSLLGGDGSNATPGFPNGPDVLVIVANNVSSSTTRIEGARFSWTEAQA
jgi:hypothetical protein